MSDRSAAERSSSVRTAGPARPMKGLMRLRRPDSSVRLRAYIFAAVALTAAAVLVHAYVVGNSTLAWWLILAASAAGAFHFHRRSRK